MRSGTTRFLLPVQTRELSSHQALPITVPTRQYTIARKHVCILLDFEEYLCCRHCAFFQRCSTHMKANLPCQKEVSA